jgi:hypothetical protein
MVEVCRGRRSDALTHISHQDLWDRRCQDVIYEQGNGASGASILGKVMTINVFTSDTTEQCPSRDLTRIHDDIEDLEI